LLGKIVGSFVSHIAENENVGLVMGGFVEDEVIANKTIGNNVGVGVGVLADVVIGD
jgi:hypothetical protein